MNGAQILLECLLKENVDTIFGYPGGVVLPLYDTFPQYPQIRHILVRHEQSAAFAADAYSRTSPERKVGVCLATSGPGATNLITGIASAKMDSVPLVAITGQVNADDIGSDAFQEVDSCGITLPITKHNYFVSDAKEIPRVIKESFHLARSGRPGPVHIDITKNVWQQIVKNWTYPEKVNLPGYSPTYKANQLQIKRAANLIKEAKKPLVITGHGTLISHAEGELKKLVETLNVPTLSTLHGISALPTDHKMYIGMLGMHGQKHANYAVSHCDLLIGIGLRFDDRVTGKIQEFAKHAKVIHIDIDPAEIGKNRAVDVPIVGDVRLVLEDLNIAVTKKQNMNWWQQIYTWKKDHDLVELAKKHKPKPNDVPRHFDVLRAISDITGGDLIVASDVGQHQMWIAQYFEFHKPRSLINSGGLGAMGFGFPAAMGIKLANPSQDVWAITGDGGFMMNCQELITLVQDQISIKIAVLNNGALGMVRQWQDLFFDKNYVATQLLNPDFVKLAESCFVKAYRVDKVKDIEPITRKAHKEKGPVLIEYRVQQEENCYPIIPPGAAIYETMAQKEIEEMKKSRCYTEPPG